MRTSIILTDGYECVIDNGNYILVKRSKVMKGKNAGKETTSNVGYFGSLEACLVKLGEELSTEAMQKRSVSLSEALECIREAHDRVIAAVKREGLQ